MFGLSARKREDDYLKRLPEKLASEWNDFSPVLRGDIWEVSCRRCPKYRAFPPRCTVPVGSRLRSCVCASIEYHLRNVQDKLVLEIGCGENPFARRVIEQGGGRWLGLDPRPGSRGRLSTRSVAGQVKYLPFADAGFDAVVGIQTIEHWEDKYAEVEDCDYGAALSEVWRVLRPGGFVYFDAPIHLHGAPAFIIGDTERIKQIFSTRPWTNMRMLSWRRFHRPLRKKVAPRKERDRWPEVLGHDQTLLKSLRGMSAWVLAIRAEKPCQTARILGRNHAH